MRSTFSGKPESTGYPSVRAVSTQTILGIPGCEQNESPEILGMPAYSSVSAVKILVLALYCTAVTLAVLLVFRRSGSEEEFTYLRTRTAPLAVA